jgi:mRNA interferase RelE/StbE
MAVDRFGEHGLGDVKKLQGAFNEWRLRVGDLRVRFEIDPGDGAVIVLRVLPRGRAYRD